MRCPVVITLMNRYLDGELPASRREEMELHLRECANCRGSVERLRKLEGVILAAPIPPVPETLLPGLMRKAREQKSSRYRPMQPPRVARWATAALLLLGLGLGGLLGIATFRPEPEAPLMPQPLEAADSVLPRYLDAFGDAPTDSVVAAVLDLASVEDNGEKNS